jgi:7,8-dihydro-6-hydroxymethylpterin dimethyltransferase
LARHFVWNQPKDQKIVREPEAKQTFLKSTRTLCPECLIPLEGTVWEAADSRVFLERTCPAHGSTRSLISSNRSGYYLRDEVPHPPPSQDTCGGPKASHRTCLALLEITDACNLSCEACYAESPAGKHHPKEELLKRLDIFIQDRGPLDILQISGGEPTIHPDFFEILDSCRDREISHIMVNTNGIVLAKDPSFAKRLTERMPNLEIYLQLDGLSREPHIKLRGKDLLEVKQQAIQAIIRHNIPTTLVCTVVDQINKDELGELLRLGLRIPQLRGITYQPATYSGRYELEETTLSRSTVSDVLDAIADQTDGQFRPDDFRPLPCSDPNCCTFTFAHRPASGPAVPVPRLMDVDSQLDQLADRIHFTTEDTGGCCGGAPQKEELFRVVIKPFMDRFTYDQQRIDECCVHIIDRQGQGVSFCEYNVLHRKNDLVQINKPRILARASS